MADAIAPGVALIVGLGNPGPKYDQTRHNAGFWFLDEVASRLGVVLRADGKFFGAVGKAVVAGRDVWLLKPDTFMNRSGQAIGALARFYKIAPEAILVAHDELDLEPGTVRLKRGGGHGGHNGLRDTINQLASKEFLRLRLGVGHPGHRDLVVDYVLNKPAQADRNAIENAIWEAERELDAIVRGDFDAVMRNLHSNT
ncbi:MAG: aminoacyl-tRNA hydrolase [Gammaproteobacteria bacterium]|nr:aminoacyl-tRNA hydrolase [Gammaproteobacteria bacterium]MCP5136279.1 aminoacyl-tRNA hydrolase [Gammaproteobacteria bacterium]